MVRGDSDRSGAVDVEALDARAGRIAKADRIGALDECALLTAVDECKPARSAEQKIRRAGADAVVGVGARKENEARLMKAGRYPHRAAPTRPSHLLRHPHPAQHPPPTPT